MPGPNFTRFPAPRSARPPACWSPNPASNPPRPWCGSAPTPTPSAAAPPTSPATSSTGGSGWRPTDACPTKPRTECEMTETPRETRVLEAVVSLVDSLLYDFDVVDLLTELTEPCAHLLVVMAAGPLLACTLH